MAFLFSAWFEESGEKEAKSGPPARDIRCFPWKKRLPAVEEAQRRLSAVSLSDHLRRYIGDLCREAHVAGHRADLVIEQAARAHAAYWDRMEVGVEDIVRVAPFALRHRSRESAPPSPPVSSWWEP